MTIFNLIFHNNQFGHLPLPFPLVTMVKKVLLWENYLQLIFFFFLLVEEDSKTKIVKKVFFFFLEKLSEEVEGRSNKKDKVLKVGVTEKSAIPVIDIL